MEAGSWALQLGGDIELVSVPHARQSSPSCQLESGASMQRGGSCVRETETERWRDRERQTETGSGHLSYRAAIRAMVAEGHVALPEGTRQVKLPGRER